MSAESVQFAEMVRLEHARIEYLKQAADERGKEIERVTATCLPRCAGRKQKWSNP